MLRIMRGEVFISLMQAVILACIFELSLGGNHVDSAVVYVALVLSSLCLISGLFLAATFKRKRSLRRPSEAG
jgi:hypothetical protein